jgi:NADH-quinone oxidoreductase subunit H
VRTDLRALLVLAIALAAALGLSACQRDLAPPLVEVTELSPSEVELGDRLELRGAGFPQGRTARITLRGALHRPGAPPVDAAIEAEGVVANPSQIELTFDERLEERFCGKGDRAIHTTFAGDVEVAFASSVPGAPPLIGTLRGASLDARPTSVSARTADARAAEGLRALAFLGMIPGPPTPRGLAIEQVASGSEADRAGIQSGDLLVAVDGVRVSRIEDVGPSSSRSAALTTRRGAEGTLDVRVVSLTGYAGARIPAELGPAIVLALLALALVVLLLVPGPAALDVLELRVAARVRRSSGRVMLGALFGRGRDALVSVAASLLLATFALGPHVLGREVDVAALAVAAFALLLTSRVSWAPSALGPLRAAASVAPSAALLILAVVVALADGGAIQLAELVRAQGGAPWETAAAQRPAAALLAAAYLGALGAILRVRDAGSAPFAAGAAGPTDAPRAGERLGLLVASVLAVALFFGGWQLPGVLPSRSLPLQALAAALFVAKTWALAALVLGAVRIASPWSARDARSFAAKRVLPLVLGAGALSLAARRAPPLAELPSAFGVALVVLLALVLVRSVVRVRLAVTRPEPQASPFL